MKTELQPEKPTLTKAQLEDLREKVYTLFSDGLLPLSTCKEVETEINRQIKQHS